MKTIISMRYNEKSDMPSMYSERYGITYSEVRREDEWVYIDIPIDEYIADDNSIRIITNILRNVLKAENRRTYILLMMIQ